MAADTIWALAKMQQQCPWLVDRLVCQVKEFLPHMDAADMTYIVWGFASLHEPLGGFLLPTLLQQVCCLAVFT